MPAEVTQPFRLAGVLIWLSGILQLTRRRSHVRGSRWLSGVGLGLSGCVGEYLINVTRMAKSKRADCNGKLMSRSGFSELIQSPPPLPAVVLQLPLLLLVVAVCEGLVSWEGSSGWCWLYRGTPALAGHGWLIPSWVPVSGFWAALIFLSLVFFGALS